MADLAVQQVERFRRGELAGLCDATVEAILDGIGFGWVQPPPRERLEAYWRGVLLVPERELFLGLLGASVAGSVQLVKPVRNFEAGQFAAHIDTHFVTPWARGHGLARMLLEAAEAEARAQGFTVMRLDVRATQERAIALYESCGYERWGTLDRYHKVDGRMIAGHFYVKDLG
ncbi:MAG TPA: GNAT family N-acetyltransferase [Alphaproteobacteria bacterium]